MSKYSSLVFSFFVFFIPSLGSADNWKNLYECQNGRNRILMMQKDTAFQLSGIQCLDSACYLVEGSYGTYALIQSANGIFEGNGISLREDSASKTVDILVIRGSLPPGRYYNCKFR
ncbi:MAG: hypothetical protein SGJ18_00225 [Pseudomonadota bacterium]|nr:hypothetical protein [Pseudomonadota bacterium]